MASSYCVELIRDNNGRRGIGFLVFGRPEENAIRAHIQSKGIQTAIDYWEFNKPNTKRWHGWDHSAFKGKYIKCIVFKDPPHRIYGFKCHPKKPEDSSYEFSVLVVHATKHEDETDENMLKICEELNCQKAVHEAVNRVLAKQVKRG